MRGCACVRLWFVEGSLPKAAGLWEAVDLGLSRGVIDQPIREFP
jgi:hypothetical protein